MAKKSSNTDGNPWHDEATGEFTEADGGSSKKGKSAKGKGKVKGSTKFQKKPALKVKEGFSLADMFAKLQDINSGISVGPLNTAEEVEQNIEKFFSKQVIGHLDRLWGTNKSGWGEKWQFNPKAHPDVNLALFTCVLGKYRYPDNHAHLLSPTDFAKLEADTEHFRKVYRGFKSEGEQRKNIIKSYITADINNIDIYGNGCYGTNIYTSTSYNYSLGYADYKAEKVLHCLVDRDARKVRSEDLSKEMSKVQDDYDWNTSKYTKKPLAISMKNKLEAHFINNGIAPDRATEMADGFISNLQHDISLMAILLGYDYQISERHDSQRNILNLKKWYIRG